MFNPFGQIGELKKMRDEAMRIQRLLQAEEVNVEKNGVEILITGDQKIKEIKTNGKSDNDIKEAINEAVKIVIIEISVVSCLKRNPKPTKIPDNNIYKERFDFK